MLIQDFVKKVTKRGREISAIYTKTATDTLFHIVLFKNFIISFNNSHRGQFDLVQINVF